MRTTLDLDEDVLQALKKRAVHEKKSIGRVLSDLVRRELWPNDGTIMRNGIRVLAKIKGSRAITTEMVNRLRDELP